jgi:hypothetical protein
MVLVAPWTVALAGSDVPVLALVFGVLVLCVTTVVMTLTPSTRRWPRNGWTVERRQHSRRSNDRRGTHRSAHFDGDGTTTIHISGRENDGPPYALPAASRPARSTASLDDPEAVITELLDTDPELLARVMSEWIRNDEGGNRTP